MVLKVLLRLDRRSICLLRPWGHASLALLSSKAHAKLACSQASLCDWAFLLKNGYFIIKVFFFLGWFLLYKVDFQFSIQICRSIHVEFLQLRYSLLLFPYRYCGSKVSILTQWQSKVENDSFKLLEDAINQMGVNTPESRKLKIGINADASNWYLEDLLKYEYDGPKMQFDSV